MADTPTFELPKAWEKLSSKFILDSLRDAKREEAAMGEPPGTQLELETCGTPAEAPLTSSPDGQPPVVEVEPCTYEPLAIAEEKKYFRIGEVSHLLGVEPHVIRYWESEFSAIRPVKAKSGHRVYTKRDVEHLHLIRHLLHVEKFSIKGAKKKLTEKKKEVASEARPKRNDELLRLLGDELRELVKYTRNHSGI